MVRRICGTKEIALLVVALGLTSVNKIARREGEWDIRGVSIGWGMDTTEPSLLAQAVVSRWAPRMQRSTRGLLPTFITVRLALCSGYTSLTGARLAPISPLVELESLTWRERSPPSSFLQGTQPRGE